jgi:hypothetical protein
MMKSSVYFSRDKKYRYCLTRSWETYGRRLLFCMLNPSTADEFKNDPTVERCQNRAMAMGFGQLVVVNIFALRSTDPKALYKAEDPYGTENMRIIIESALSSEMVICGWGKHGSLHNHGKFVLQKLCNHGIIPHALKLNKDGSPAHPLYIGYDVKPFPIDFCELK